MYVISVEVNHGRVAANSHFGAKWIYTSILAGNFLEMETILDIYGEASLQLEALVYKEWVVAYTSSFLTI